MKLAIGSCVILLAACASTNEIQQVGKDAYIVSGWGKSPGGYSGSEVKTAAIREASKFCSSKGKQLQVVSANQRDMSFGVNATAELQFMCLSSTDSDFSRTTIKRESDASVEVRKEINVNDESQKKSMYDELLKLDELRKRGIITEAEFQNEKAKRIGKR